MSGTQLRNSEEPDHALGCFYSFLLDNAGLVDENGLPVPNPMGPISKHKPKVERRINGWLREDEDVRFMAGAMTLIEKTIIFLLRFTGLRVSEAVSLRIRDVNLLTCSRTNADGRISGAEEAPSLRDMAAVTQLRA